ncbi:MAG: hypothetical protein PUE51_05395 [Veillonellaceae bacterium]|nr:hypothetical protein [Veillonellaceae bacterium]
MRWLGESGMASVFGLVMLGVMVLAAMGVFAVERNEAYATQRYEDEVRLRLAARSEVERAALQFEKGGGKTDVTEASLGGKKEEDSPVTRPDGIMYQTRVYFEKGELMVSATAWLAADEPRFSLMKSYVRARAHLARSQEGAYYVWLGWVP